MRRGTGGRAANLVLSGACAAGSGRRPSRGRGSPVQPPLLRGLARIGPLRALLSFLLRPRVSLGVWAAVIAAWHVPAAYDYTLVNQAVHDLEHATFVLAGFLVWSQLVDPARRGVLTVG